MKFESTVTTFVLTSWLADLCQFALYKFNLYLNYVLSPEKVQDTHRYVTVLQVLNVQIAERLFSKIVDCFL